MRIDPVRLVVHTSKGSGQRSIDVGSVAGARYARRDVGGTRRKLDDLLAQGNRPHGRIHPFSALPDTCSHSRRNSKSRAR